MLSLRRALPASRLLRGPVLQLQRGYQGNLQDKDRIFTNLYNDGSQFLEGAKKRVRCCLMTSGASLFPAPLPPSMEVARLRRTAMRVLTG